MLPSLDYLPLSLKFYFNRNGTLFIRFNQETVVPRNSNLTGNSTNSTARSLIDDGRILEQIQNQTHVMPELNDSFKINGSALSF